MEKIYYPYPAKDNIHKYYIIRKSIIDTAGWWSKWYLWSYPTKKQSYDYIKSHFLK